VEEKRKRNKRKKWGEGQSSLLSGLFPGDAILEVNDEGVKYAPVEVVEAIT